MRAALRAAAVAASACLVLTGCDRPAPDDGGVGGGSSAQEGAGDTGRGAEARGAPKGNGGPAPGKPKSGGGGGLAPGSPMTMPARTQDSGDPLADKLAYIKSRLATQCGGSLCVKVEVEYDTRGVNCRYQGSDPEPGSTFYYRKNLVVTVYASCDEEPSEGPSPDDGSSGDGQGNGQPGDEQSNGQPDDEQSAEPGAGGGSS